MSVQFVFCCMCCCTRHFIGNISDKYTSVSKDLQFNLKLVRLLFCHSMPTYVVPVSIILLKGSPVHLQGHYSEQHKTQYQCIHQHQTQKQDR